MNQATRDIMELLGVSAEKALEVQTAMEINGLDFSECSQRQFNRAAREALRECTDTDEAPR